MSNILVDTGFWIALFNQRDRHHAEAEARPAYLWPQNVVFPWPVLFETSNTRFARNHAGLRRFEALIKGPKAVLLDDAPYRQDALHLLFTSSLRRNRPLSLADCVLRLIIDDPDARIDFLATFNVGDFADICRKRRVQLLGAGAA